MIVWLWQVKALSCLNHSILTDVLAYCFSRFHVKVTISCKPILVDAFAFATFCTCLFASVMACHEIVAESGPLGCVRLSSANWLVVTIKCHIKSNSKSKATLILWWTFTDYTFAV